MRSIAAYANNEQLIDIQEAHTQAAKALFDCDALIEDETQGIMVTALKTGSLRTVIYKWSDGVEQRGLLPKEIWHPRQGWVKSIIPKDDEMARRSELRLADINLRLDDNKLKNADADILEGMLKYVIPDEPIELLPKI